MCWLFCHFCILFCLNHLNFLSFSWQTQTRLFCHFCILFCLNHLNFLSSERFGIHLNDIFYNVAVLKLAGRTSNRVVWCVDYFVIFVFYFYFVLTIWTWQSEIGRTDFVLFDVLIILSFLYFILELSFVSWQTQTSKARLNDLVSI